MENTIEGLEDIKRKELYTYLNLTPEYVTNGYGAKIRKACVSCQYGVAGGVDTETGESWNEMCPVRAKMFKRTYKPLDEDHPIEDKLHKCGNWKMKLGLRNAGKGSGKVRTKTEIVESQKRHIEEAEQKRIELLRKIRESDD